MNTGMEIDFVAGLPRSQLLETVAAAERNTSISDAELRRGLRSEPLLDCRNHRTDFGRSPAPVYGLYDTLLGHGIVGGSLHPRSPRASSLVVWRFGS